MCLNLTCFPQTAETHGWLSAYEDCWPARVYLNRYWRARTRNRRQYNMGSKHIEVASLRRRGRPPKRQREEAASNVQTTPEQVYFLQPSKQKQFVLSDDVRSLSSSDTEDSSSEFRDENESTMSPFDRVQLNVRQRRQCMPPDEQAGPQLRRSPPPSFPGTRRNRSRKTTSLGSSTLKQSALSHDSDTDFSQRRVFVAPRMEEGHDSGSKPSGADSEPVKRFLSSLRPSLESHLGAFLELGVRDHATLMAFLSWPQAMQEQWIDNENETLQLTRLERGSLLVGCNMFIFGVLQRSL
ncbi:hypothetical protein BDN67DRAFT_718420 [Paxillus ammoniavirescens]|nr:hypothetical protein BDN67DRAFT_718420 [Paxillus ammoniavirescens]